VTHRRQQLIVQACVAAIAEKGYSSTSIREIASRAGMSVGTLLHHFASKQEILTACMDHIIETWDGRAEEILTGRGSPLQRLERLIRWVLADPEYDHLWRVYMAFWHEAIFNPQTKAAILEGSVTWDASVGRCVGEAIEAGELVGDDPERIGRSLTTMIDGVAIHIHGRLGRWDRESGVALCLDFLRSHQPSAARDSAAAIVREVVAAWNSHDVERICEHFHDDFENWQAPLPTVRGLDAYRRHLTRWFDAYPGLHLEIVTLFADGNTVCLETTASGSPVDSFFGVAPNVAGGVNRALDVLVLREGKVWRQR
jgi:AcrR family transcriptional regulator